MPTLELLSEGRLSLRFSLMEQVAAFRCSSEMVFPLSAITSITAEGPCNSWAVFRCPGTSLPGYIAAGTYYVPREGQSRSKQLWYVRGSRPPCLSLGLVGCGYDRVVLSFASEKEVQAWVEDLNSAKKE
eukprot:NODE_6162_length_565_cov_12.682648_g5997_i0.p2 GENE.NODE_6162_length_565_cov_12.682648_g5997_i0~~NODE_6162_length_565_cov_12.682648_g5997_i0.p2  ORF type:complete len:144 (+),score=52.60 NODE_6162_length_565_cov_12.682648_g5997_i0:47-433(+)